MATRERQAPSLQIWELPMQTELSCLFFPPGHQHGSYFISIYIVWVTIRDLPYKTANFSSTKNPPKTPKSPNSQLMHLLCALIFFSQQVELGPQFRSRYRQYLWDWRLPCFRRSSGIFAAGYIAAGAIQAKEAFPAKEIWSCLPPANVKNILHKVEVFCVVGKGERKAAPFVLSRDVYFTSLSHIDEIKATEDCTTTPLASGGEGSFPWGSHPHWYYSDGSTWLLSKGCSIEAPSIKWSKCSLH